MAPADVQQITVELKKLSDQMAQLLTKQEVTAVELRYIKEHAARLEKAIDDVAKTNVVFRAEVQEEIDSKLAAIEAKAAEDRKEVAKASGEWGVWLRWALPLLAAGLIGAVGYFIGQGNQPKTRPDHGAASSNPSPPNKSGAPPPTHR
jgi:hypothetical protein